MGKTILFEKRELFMTFALAFQPTPRRDGLFRAESFPQLFSKDRRGRRNHR
jgi:hypothetical protein